MEEEEVARKRKWEETSAERKQQEVLKKFRDRTQHKWYDKEERRWANKCHRIDRRLWEISKRLGEELSASEKDALHAERTLLWAEKTKVDQTWKFVVHGGVHDVEGYNVFVKEREEQFEKGQINHQKEAEEERACREQAREICRQLQRRTVPTKRKKVRRWRRKNAPVDAKAKKTVAQSVASKYANNIETCAATVERNSVCVILRVVVHAETATR